MVDDGIGGYDEMDGDADAMDEDDAHEAEHRSKRLKADKPPKEDKKGEDYK